MNEGKGREVFTASGTYPWLFVTQVFHNKRFHSTAILVLHLLIHRHESEI